LKQIRIPKTIPRTSITWKLIGEVVGEAYEMTSSLAPLLERQATKPLIAKSTAPSDSAQADEANSSSQLSAAVLASLASALLVACGGGGGSGGGSGGSAGLPSAPGFNNSPTAKTDEEAARFLQQSQFASTPEDIAAVKATNFADYLQQQFAKPLNTGWDWLMSRGYGANATVDKNVYNGTIADCMVWRDLFSAPDAMRKRVALALSEFFVVSMNSMEIDWRGFTITAYWDLLNKHAFGNFRNLLEDITLNPAMGHYLNTRGNKKANTSGRLPDENYAREVMQLFTIGLYELNLDGSVKTDGTGKKLESYDADDVSQLARVFTGYDYDKAYNPYAGGVGIDFPNGGYKVMGLNYARSPMTLNASDHSPEEINFLTTRIPANTPGAAALKTALDALFNHPNVGPFFGRQMIQRLVTSNPSGAYVARVASAFNNNGAGVRGDMKAVLTAIFLDDEARGTASLSNPLFGKVREPMVRLAQWARSFGVVSKAGSWKIFDQSDSSYALGQSPLHAPSVFNFFRPGYVAPGTAMAAANPPATTPEFQIINETTVGSYVNFMQYTIRDGLYTFDPDTPEITYNKGGRTDVVPDYTNLFAMINNATITDAEALRVAQSLVTRLNVVLTAGQLSPSTLTAITNALQAAMLQSGKRITNASTESLKRDLVASAIFMIMASSDYLVQK
jgi:uncharacterized protein (DUF1800 family)